MLLPEGTGYDEFCKSLLESGDDALLLWLADWTPQKIRFADAKGGEEGTIGRWFEVTASFEPRRRTEWAAANVVFAELTGSQVQWRRAVEERAVGESTYLNEIRTEGEVKGRASSLLKLLGRYGPVPADLEAAICACKDQQKLDAWFDVALDRPSIDEFRQRTGL